MGIGYSLNAPPPPRRIFNPNTNEWEVHVYTFDEYDRPRIIVYHYPVGSPGFPPPPGWSPELDPTLSQSEPTNSLRTNSSQNSAQTTQKTQLYQLQRTPLQTSQSIQPQLQTVQPQIQSQVQPQFQTPQLQTVQPQLQPQLQTQPQGMNYPPNVSRDNYPGLYTSQNSLMFPLPPQFLTAEAPVSPPVLVQPPMYYSYIPVSQLRKQTNIPQQQMQSPSLQTSVQPPVQSPVQSLQPEAQPSVQTPVQSVQPSVQLSVQPAQPSVQSPQVQTQEQSTEQQLLQQPLLQPILIEQEQSRGPVLQPLFQEVPQPQPKSSPSLAKKFNFGTTGKPKVKPFAAHDDL